MLLSGGSITPGMCRRSRESGRRRCLWWYSTVNSTVPGGTSCTGRCPEHMSGWALALDRTDHCTLCGQRRSGHEWQLRPQRRRRYQAILSVPRDDWSSMQASWQWNRTVDHPYAHPPLGKKSDHHSHINVSDCLHRINVMKRTQSFVTAPSPGAISKWLRIDRTSPKRGASQVARMESFD